MMLILDVVILLYGIYTIYATVRMKKTQQMNGWFVGSQSSNIRDQRGYIQYIYGKTLVMGGICMLFGAVSLINDYVVEIRGMMGGMLLLFLTACVWFYISMSKAKRMFW